MYQISPEEDILRLQADERQRRLDKKVSSSNN
jgi:hypothetical protein